MKIEIVTDSTSDVPPEIAESYPIHIVPALLNIGGQSLEDGPEISRREYYERLPGLQVLPTTSSPSVGSFLKLYTKIFQQGGEHILSLHPPAGLSGIYNAARLAAQNFGKKVTVMDSGFVTMGLGFQAMEASEIARTDLPMEEVISRVNEMRQRIHLVAMLDTLEYVRRSGRVSWGKAALGALFNLKPFVGMKDGAVLRFGETRTRQKGLERLKQLLINLGPLERLAILHTNIEEDARQFLASLSVKIASQPLVVNVTTVIGTHVGPKGLGFVAVVH